MPRRYTAEEVLRRVKELEARRRTGQRLTPTRQELDAELAASTRYAVPPEEVAAFQARPFAEKWRTYARPLVTPEQVEALPGPLPIVGRGIRELTSPPQIAQLTATAGFGPAVAGGIRGGTGLLGFLRGLAAGAVAPVVKGPFATRLAAELGVQAAGATAAMETARRTQNMPLPVRIAAPLAAGFAGAGGAIGAGKVIAKSAPGVARTAGPVVRRALAEERGGTLPRKTLVQPDTVHYYGGERAARERLQELRGIAVDPSVTPERVREVQAEIRDIHDVLSAPRGRPVLYKSRSPEYFADREQFLRDFAEKARKEVAPDILDYVRRGGKLQESLASYVARGGSPDEMLVIAEGELADLTTVVTPAWGKGLSKQQLRSMARQEGVNPYLPDWGDSLDRKVIAEARRGAYKNPNDWTMTELKRLISDLRAQVKMATPPKGARRTAPDIRQAEFGKAGDITASPVFRAESGRLERQAEFMAGPERSIRQSAQAQGERQAALARGQGEMPLAEGPEAAFVRLADRDLPNELADEVVSAYRQADAQTVAGLADEFAGTPVGEALRQRAQALLPAPESAAAKAAPAIETPRTRTYRGMSEQPMGGVESGRFPGLHFSSEQPEVAALYAQGPRGNVQQRLVKANKVLDLTNQGSMEGSDAIRQAIGKALGQDLRLDADIAPTLRAAGYDAVKVREHVLGRHGPATTWIEVLPAPSPAAKPKFVGVGKTALGAKAEVDVTGVKPEAPSIRLPAPATITSRASAEQAALPAPTVKDSLTVAPAIAAKPSGLPPSPEVPAQPPRGLAPSASGASPPGGALVKPPIAALEPPSRPPPGRLLGQLQDVDELVTTMSNPDVKRRIANLPVVKSFFGTFNPAGVMKTDAEKAGVAFNALREEGKNKTIGAFSTLESLGKREQVWGRLDDQGRLTQGPLKGTSLDEALTYRAKYNEALTTPQRSWAEQFHALTEAKREFVENAGIRVNELSFEEGGEYVGRRVMGRMDPTTGEMAEAAFLGAGPGRPGAKAAFEKTRVYQDVNDALKDGFRYLPPDEALFLNLQAATNRVAAKMVADWAMARIPWRSTEVFSLPKAMMMVNMALRKGAPTPAQLTALGRDMPEVAARFKAALEIEDWPTRYSTLQGLKEALKKTIPDSEGQAFWAAEYYQRQGHTVENGIEAMQRALRGESLPMGTVKAIERVAPKLEGKLAESTRTSLEELIRAGQEAATYPRTLEVPKPGLITRYQKALAQAEAELAQSPGNAALQREVNRLRSKLGFTKYRVSLGEPMEFSKSPVRILTESRRKALEDALTVLRGEPYDARTATGNRVTKYRGGVLKEFKEAELNARQARHEIAERARTARYGEATVVASAFQGRILTGPEARANAEALNKAFTTQFGPIDNMIAQVNKANAVSRYFVLAGDASAFMIQLIAFPMRFPRTTAKAMAGFVDALFNEKALAAYLARNNQAIQEARNLVLSKGGQTEYTEAFRTIRWLTAKYSPGRLLVPFQRAFEAALDTAGIELWKGMRHRATTPQKVAEIEQFINEVRGVTSSARLGVSPQIRAGETAVFLAPRYNRAFAAWATDVISGGLRGEEARKSLGALIAGTIAIAIAIGKARGESDEEIARHLIPGTNDFLTWDLWGQRVGPGSKVRSSLMLAGRIAQDPQDTVGHVARFTRAQLAPVPGKSIDVVTGRNFIGEPTRPGRNVGWGEGMLGFGKNVLAEGMMPISLQGVAMEGGEIEERAVRGAVEFFGGRAYPITPYQLFRKDLEEYERIPSNETEREAKKAQFPKSRYDYLKANRMVEAKLYISGERESVIDTGKHPGTDTRALIIQLMLENRIKPEDVPGLREKEYESDDRKKLRLAITNALKSLEAQPVSSGAAQPRSVTPSVTPSAAPVAIPTPQRTRWQEIADQVRELEAARR